MIDISWFSLASLKRPDQQVASNLFQRIEQAHATTDELLLLDQRILDRLQGQQRIEAATEAIAVAGRAVAVAGPSPTWNGTPDAAAPTPARPATLPTRPLPSIRTGLTFCSLMRQNLPQPVKQTLIDPAGTARHASATSASRQNIHY